MLLTTLNTRS